MTTLCKAKTHAEYIEVKGGDEKVVCELKDGGARGGNVLVFDIEEQQASNVSYVGNGTLVSLGVMTAHPEAKVSLTGSAGTEYLTAFNPENSGQIEFKHFDPETGDEIVIYSQDAESLAAALNAGNWEALSFELNVTDNLGDDMLSQLTATPVALEDTKEPVVILN